MNFLPARGTGEGIEVAGRGLPAPLAQLGRLASFTLGVRPEYVRLSDDEDAGALPAVVSQAQDIGTYWLVTARLGAEPGAPLLRARLGSDQAIPQVGQQVWLQVVGAHTCYYVNEELIA